MSFERRHRHSPLLILFLVVSNFKLHDGRKAQAAVPGGLDRRVHGGTGREAQTAGLPGGGLRQRVCQVHAEQPGRQTAAYQLSLNLGTCKVDSLSLLIA